jgi:hypothetical protein
LVLHSARGRVLVRFMVVTILFGFVWQIATQRLKISN